MSVATATLVRFVGRLSVIHLPLEEPAPAEKLRAKSKHHMTERPACCCCGVTHFTVRAVERAELKEGAAPWLTHLCAKCGLRLLRRTPGAESY
jgi:hypothetical protein